MELAASRRTLAAAGGAELTPERGLPTDRMDDNTDGGATAPGARPPVVAPRGQTRKERTLESLLDERNEAEALLRELAGAWVGRPTFLPPCGWAVDVGAACGGPMRSRKPARDEDDDAIAAALRRRR